MSGIVPGPGPRRRRTPGYRGRHPGIVWIEQHRHELQSNRWVAASASGLVAQSSSNRGLMDAISKKGLKPSDVAIAFISADAM